MIIKNSATIETNSQFPHTDWYDEGNYIIDETTEQGKQMAQMYIDNYPFVDIEVDKNNFVTKVIVLDKPERPPEIPGKQIVLKQDENGNWYYDYEDRPKSQEEILEGKIMAQEQAIAELTLLLSMMMGGAE